MIPNKYTKGFLYILNPNEPYINIIQKWFFRNVLSKELHKGFAYRII